MALWLRVLLWLVVALVPGGLLLLPLLLGDAWRRNKSRRPPESDIPDADPYLHFEPSPDGRS